MFCFFVFFYYHQFYQIYSADEVGLENDNLHKLSTKSDNEMLIWKFNTVRTLSLIKSTKEENQLQQFLEYDSEHFQGLEKTHYKILNQSYS